jgi:uncharacterized protein YjiS (DUF1127 family)
MRKLKLLARKMQAAVTTRNERRRLVKSVAHLDDRMLNDIGITPKSEVYQIVARKWPHLY